MLQFTNITQIIFKLLYKHDCVIVPHFGGFVARSYTSTFSKGDNVLCPPSKQILFNKNLVHNDGLLITTLMQENDSLFNEAEKLLIDYKDYIQSLLAVKKRFELQDIGLLYIDTENVLRFEPKTNSNFLLHSFGFEPVIANELIIETEKLISVKHFEDRKVVVEAHPKNKKPYLQLATFAIGLPIVLAFLLFAAYAKPMKPLLQSSFNPFYTPEKTYSPRKQNNVSFIIKPTEKQTLLTDANGYATLQLSFNGAVLVAIANDSTIKVDKTLVKKPLVSLNTPQFDGKFQIVMGCFGVEENAKRLIETLKQKNIIAAISGVNAKGMHVVSCGGFNTKQDASTRLASVKIAHPNAWIMAK